MRVTPCDCFNYYHYYFRNGGNNDDDDGDGGNCRSELEIYRGGGRANRDLLNVPRL